MSFVTSYSSCLLMLKGKIRFRWGKHGVPERIRTYDLWIRSPLLYPPGHMGKTRFPGEIVLFSFTHL